jgi:pSer/pThr/pTyr-binding forkhead associated (FHA) protein
MAKLYLKFEERVIREIALSGGVVTIGRQPDNLVQIDNPAVSGHHAKVYWEGDHYVLEDTESFNGTYANNRRISRAVLKDGDVVLVGKHTIEFRDQGSEAAPALNRTVDRSIYLQDLLDKTRPLQLDQTVMLDTRKAKEMLAKAAAATSNSNCVGQQTLGSSSKLTVSHVGIGGRRRIGTLTVIDGKTNQQHYVLSSKLSVIGKSDMASIRLKRWFAPRTAASIQQREDGYFIVTAGNNSQIRVNNAQVTAGRKELKAGDVIEVAGIKAIFGYEA